MVQKPFSGVKKITFFWVLLTTDKIIDLRREIQALSMARIVNGDCVKSAMVNMEYGHVMFVETWTFISDGMWQKNSNCVVVALVITTVVIIVFVTEYVIFRHVRKH